MKETWTRRAKVARTGLAFVALFGVALQGLISTPQGLAGDNATVNVSANVVGTCKFTTASATLSFSLDPSVGTDVTATATPSLEFWCTKGASYTVTDDDGIYETSSGQHRMKHASLDEYIPYSFNYTPTSGTGSGPANPITLSISGTVAYDDYANASAGSYSDTVKVTLRP
jgi:spore coat protein U-like protein